MNSLLTGTAGFTHNSPILAPKPLTTPSAADVASKHLGTSILEGMQKTSSSASPISAKPQTASMAIPHINLLEAVMRIPSSGRSSPAPISPNSANYYEMIRSNNTSPDTGYSSSSSSYYPSSHLTPNFSPHQDSHVPPIKSKRSGSCPNGKILIPSTEGIWKLQQAEVPSSLGNSYPPRTNVSAESWAKTTNAQPAPLQELSTHAETQRRMLLPDSPGIVGLGTLCLKTLTPFEKLDKSKSATKPRIQGPVTPLAQRVQAQERNILLVAELFEKLKKDQCEAAILDFLKKLPKVDLHNHLTGSIYMETYLKIAVLKQLYFDPTTFRFHKENHASRITAQALVCEEKHKATYEALKKTWSMEGCSTGARGGHDHFFDKIWDIISSLTQYMTLNEKLYPVLKHDLHENVVYKEVMIELLPTAPIPAQFKTLYEQGKLLEALNVLKESWLSSYVKEQVATIDTSSEAMAKQLNLEVSTITNPKSPIVVGYMIEVLRDQPNDIFFAHIAAAMALIKAHPNVIAVNIDGPEASELAIKNFKTQMKILDFLWNQFDRPNISLHAGEVNHYLCDPIDVQHHIRDSILIGRAKRIGHGASLECEDTPKLLNLMKVEKVAVEVCFSSNKHMLKIQPKSHPMNLYKKAGIPVILCTDDEGIMRSSLTKEYLMGTRAGDLTYQDIRKMCIDGIEYSFQNESQVKSEKANSLKTQLRIRMHNLLTEFEAKILTTWGELYK